MSVHEEPVVRVVPAKREQQAALANLLELYIHDFSEFFPVELGADGRFGYPRLPLYWEEAGRHPLFIEANGILAGFALVKRGSELSDRLDVWDMAEFFIVRGHRRQGIGMQAAREVWKMFPGPWEVRVMESNAAALHFWRQAVATTDANARESSVVRDGRRWYVFAFGQ